VPRGKALNWLTIKIKKIITNKFRVCVCVCRGMWGCDGDKMKILNNYNWFYWLEHKLGATNRNKYIWV